MIPHVIVLEPGLVIYKIAEEVTLALRGGRAGAAMRVTLFVLAIAFAGLVITAYAAGGLVPT